MRDIITPQQIYPALQVLLALPDHCVSFELGVAAWQCGVTVACEHYVALDAPGLKQRESVFSQYELLHRSRPDADEQFRVIDFEVWMRDRAERAHAEFMAQTSRLPA